MKLGKHFTLAMLALTLLLLVTGSAVTGVAARASKLPYSTVSIVMQPIGKGEARTVTISEPKIVSRLFNDSLNLPEPPKDQVCPMFLVAHLYNLVFSGPVSGKQTFVLDFGGCRHLTVGENDVRQTTDAYIQFFNRIVTDAVAAYTPNRLSVRSFTDVERPPVSTILTNPAQVQSLYSALFALPRLPDRQPCPAIAGPHYTLVFSDHGKKVASVTLDRSGCGTAVIDTLMRLNGETRLVSKNFWQLWEASLKSGKSTRALPTKLELFKQDISNDPQSPTKTVNVKNIGLIQRVYNAIYALPPLDIARLCVARVGPHYNLTFRDSQGELLTAVADKSGCGFVTLADGINRQPDAAFWSLLRTTEYA